MMVVVVVVVIAKLQFLSNRCVFNNPLPRAIKTSSRKELIASSPPNTTCLFVSWGGFSFKYSHVQTNTSANLNIIT